MHKRVPVVPGMSRKKIELLATSILRECQPRTLVGDDPVDVESIYEFYIPERHGITVSYTDLSYLGQGILGYTDAETRTSFVDSSLSDALDQATVRRFRATVAHEIDHCIQHVPILRLFRSISKKGEENGLFRVDKRIIRPYENPEWQAWEFARSLLMPKVRLLKYIQKGYGLRKMADLFDVNPRFLEVRLDTLKIKI